MWVFSPFYIFVLDDDTKQNKIDHSPDYYILLILVNKDYDIFALFLLSYDEICIDKDRQRGESNNTMNWKFELNPKIENDSLFHYQK